jgi:tetratricopeptide (TPR) repeat protein
VRLTAAIVVLLTAGAAHAQDDAATWLARAEAAFAAGRKQSADADRARPLFRQAADAYEQVRQRGAANPDLFLAQGNASALAGDLGGAVLAYRRGLRLDPLNPDLRAGLDYARAQIGSPGPVVTASEWLALLAGRLAAGLSAGLTVVGFLLTVWAWRRHRPGWRFVGAGILAVGLWLWVASFGAYEALRQYQGDRSAAVITADGVVLRQGNGPNYWPRLDKPLPRGSEVRELGRRGDWVQVEVGGGAVGWVPAATVAEE